MTQVVGFFVNPRSKLKRQNLQIYQNINLMNSILTRLL